MCYLCRSIAHLLMIIKDFLIVLYINIFLIIYKEYFINMCIITYILWFFLRNMKSLSPLEV